MKRYFIFTIPFLLLLCGCNEEEPTIVEQKQKPKPTPLEYGVLSTSNLFININGSGLVSQTDPMWYYQKYPGNIGRLGLYVAGKRDGFIKANVVGHTPFWFQSNYSRIINNDTTGVFFITSDSLMNVDYEGLLKYNFPPLLIQHKTSYGDQMTWSAQTSISVPDVTWMVNPIEDILVTQAYWTNNAEPNAIYFDYELTNLAQNNLEELYLGVWSDLDLYRHEKAGYDSSLGFTYIYADTLFPDTTVYTIMGYAFLNPENGINEFKGVTSSRIMIRDSHPEFGEFDLTPGMIFNSLKGLSNSGADMINPVTGMSTKFAFTGDPITKTGWLDNMRDTRSLISSGPYSLTHQQTTKLRGVILITQGNTLEEVLTNMKNQFLIIKENSTAWDF